MVDMEERRSGGDDDSIHATHAVCCVLVGRKEPDNPSFAHVTVSGTLFPNRPSLSESEF